MQKLVLLFILFSFMGILKGDDEAFQLEGTIKSNSGELLAHIEVGIWYYGVRLLHTKTNKHGRYLLPLRNTGRFQLLVGGNNKYFHNYEDEEFDVFHLGISQVNIILEANSYVLNHECTRLKEANNQMVLNPKNKDYKKLYFQKFPNNMNELELYFNKKNKKLNLYRKRIYFIEKFFFGNLTKPEAYALKIIDFCKDAYPALENSITNIYAEYAFNFILQYTKELNIVLEKDYTEDEIRDFWDFFFFSGFKKNIPKKIIEASTTYPTSNKILNEYLMY